jgi:CheY-like chemotaxis protein
MRLSFLRRGPRRNVAIGASSGRFASGWSSATSYVFPSARGLARIDEANWPIIPRSSCAQEVAVEQVGRVRIGEADELLAQVAEHEPDVAIVDIRMPPDTDGGLRAAREIRSRHRTVGVLVLSQYARPSYAFELLSESAERVGYLLKDRVGDWASSPTPSAASVGANRCSTRSSSPSSSGVRAKAATRSTASATVSARCSR